MKIECCGSTSLPFPIAGSDLVNQPEGVYENANGGIILVIDHAQGGKALVHIWNFFGAKYISATSKPTLSYRRVDKKLCLEVK